MDYKEIIISALQALRRNVLRTGLTMLGIIIGIASVILIYSIGQGAVAFITGELASFGTDYFQINPGTNQLSALAGSTSLTFDDVEAIRNDGSLTNVKNVAPFAMASITVSANDEKEELLTYGVTPEFVDILRPTVLAGEMISAEHELASERVTVLGSTAAETFFGEDALPVGETVLIGNHNFRIIGIIESSSALAGGFLNNAIFIPIDIVTDELLGEKKLQEIDISVYDQNSINQTIDDVEQLLRDRHGLDENEENDFRIESAQDILTTVETITSLLTVMIVAISAISLLVGGVGVMNIMLVSVTERTREIGLLKAIGAREKDILTQFLVESVVMSLIGGLIGIAIGIGGAFMLSLAFKIPFIISLPAILIAASVSSLVGIVFGVFPARKAAHLSPIEALRYE